MEAIQNEGGQRNWSDWYQLQDNLGEARKKHFGIRNQEYNGYKKEIKIQNFSMQRRRKNCIDRLVNGQGIECRTLEKIEKEIAFSYYSLFTSPNPSH